MLVVGVSGVTNGGKTTVAKALHEALPRSHLICQDTYFLPKESTRHVLIPELGHFNWEIMSSLDMDKMWNDIELIKRKLDDKGSTKNSTFAIKEKETNKDVPGYFDLCVWPEYVKHKEEMLQSVGDVKVVDGTQSLKSIIDEVLNDISKKMNEMMFKYSETS